MNFWTVLIHFESSKYKSYLGPYDSPYGCLIEILLGFFVTQKLANNAGRKILSINFRSKKVFVSSSVFFHRKETVE